MSDLSWMLAPTVACLVVVAALGWFGLHVLQRGVIFVDLALAQIAALGATFALYLGHDPDEPVALVLALAFTAVGSVAFAAIREFEDRVPAEALIGITYAVSAALGILLIELASDPHGAEKIQHLMVGNIVWVRWSEIGVAAAAIAGVGLAHAIFGRRFLEISFDADGARERGVHIGLWDLVFYLTFGIVLTAIVSIVGVLLVFSFLVIPSVIARLVADRVAPRLAVAWLIGAAASIGGVAVSYEHSTGPIVVAILGGLLITTLSAVSVWRAPRRGLRAAQVGGVAVALLLVVIGVSRMQPHSEHEHAAPLDEPDSHLDEHDGLVHEHPAHDDAPTDAFGRLEAAVREARAGDVQGLVELAALCQDAPPFIRMEAHDRLSAVAGDSAPAYDPQAANDEQGLWAAWAASPPEGWENAAAEMAMP